LSDACPQGYRVLAGPRVGAGIVQPLTECDIGQVDLDVCLPPNELLNLSVLLGVIIRTQENKND